MHVADMPTRPERFLAPLAMLNPFAIMQLQSHGHQEGLTLTELMSRCKDARYVLQAACTGIAERHAQALAHQLQLRVPWSAGPLQHAQEQLQPESMHTNLPSHKAEQAAAGATAQDTSTWKHHPHATWAAAPQAPDLQHAADCSAAPDSPRTTFSSPAPGPGSHADFSVHDDQHAAWQSMHQPRAQVQHRQQREGRSRASEWPQALADLPSNSGDDVSAERNGCNAMPSPASGSSDDLHSLLTMHGHTSRPQQHIAADRGSPGVMQLSPDGFNVLLVSHQV